MSVEVNRDGERLARIEGLLEMHIERSELSRKELIEKVDHLEQRLREIEGYKNRAYGMLIMFGMVAGGAGAGIAKAAQAIL